MPSPFCVSHCDTSPLRFKRFLGISGVQRQCTRPLKDTLISKKLGQSRFFVCFFLVCFFKFRLDGPFRTRHVVLSMSQFEA